MKSKHLHGCAVGQIGFCHGVWPFVVLQERCAHSERISSLGSEEQEVSVAFRRDCDEEHMEPRFELPIPVGPNLVTRRGLKQIEAQVVLCEARVAAETEELSVNNAKRDLRYWRTRLATAQIVPPPSLDQVAFGSCVTFQLNGVVRVINIVGDDEADPANGYIAFSAPLARALMGAVAGDLADFAGKQDAVEIVDVSIFPL